MGSRSDMSHPGPDTGKVDIKKEVARQYGVTRKTLDELLDAPLKVEEGKADKEQVFLMYAAFGGDIFRSAHACGVTPEEVTTWAEEGKWLDRIRALIELKKGDKSKDVERGISRAMNFVQANRYRMILDQIIRWLERMTPAEVLRECMTEKVDKNGNVVSRSLSFKLLADLATALEKTHWLTYQSMLDAPQDRAGRREKAPDIDTTESDIHAKIAKTLAGMVEHTPAQQIALAQQQQVRALAEDIREANGSPPPPIDVLATPVPGQA